MRAHACATLHPYPRVPGLLKQATVAAAGRWEVRIGLPGGRHVYLGLYPTEPEAARVYDRALVLLSGPAAATNFPASNYSYEMSLYTR